MRISDWSSDVCSSDLDDRDQQRRDPQLPDQTEIGRWQGERRQALRNSADEIDAAILEIEDNGGEDRGEDRKSVVWGKSTSVRVDLGGGRIIKKKQLLQKSLQCHNR